MGLAKKFLPYGFLLSAFPKSAQKNFCVNASTRFLCKLINNNIKNIKKAARRVPFLVLPEITMASSFKPFPTTFLLISSSQIFSVIVAIATDSYYFETKLSVLKRQKIKYVGCI